MKKIILKTTVSAIVLSLSLFITNALAIEPPPEGEVQGEVSEGIDTPRFTEELGISSEQKEQLWEQKYQEKLKRN